MQSLQAILVAATVQLVTPVQTQALRLWQQVVSLQLLQQARQLSPQRKQL
jgi:hypothetical protein